MISGKNNLSSFVGKKMEDIQVDVTYPLDYDLFLELLDKKSLTDGDILNMTFNNPTSIASIIRKKYILAYNKEVTSKTKSLILNIYLKFLLASKYKITQDQDLAISQNLAKLSSQEIKDLEDRLYVLYTHNLFPSVITKQIKNFYMQPVSEAELKEILDFKTLPSSQISVKEKKVISTDVLLQVSGDILSPTYVHPNMIYIDKYPYPSLSHYILMISLLNLPDAASFINMRFLLLKDPQESQNNVNNYKNISQLTDIFFDMENSLLNKKKLELLTTALNYKFSEIQSGRVELLKKSFPARLIYDDPFDNFLGTGRDGNGKNMTGFVLEKIRRDNSISQLTAKPQVFASREKWRKRLKGGQEAIYPRAVLSNYVGDGYLAVWVDGRLKDICRVMGLVHRYVENMSGKRILINKNLSNFVIRTLYKTCLSLSETQVRDVPLDLKEKMVKYLPEGVGVGDEAIQNVWRYLDNLIYNLKLKVGDDLNDSNVKNKLDDIIDNIISDGGSHSSCKGPYPIFDKFKNCIFRAYLTVCMSIKNFVTTNYGVKNLDLDTDLLSVAASIIYIDDINLTYKPLNLGKEDDKILQYLPSFDPRSVLEELNGIYEMYNKPISNKLQMKVAIRLQFFLNESPI